MIHFKSRTNGLERGFKLVGRVALTFIILSLLSYFVGIISILNGNCFSSLKPILAPLALFPAMVAVGLLAALALLKRALREWVVVCCLLLLCALGVFGLTLFHCGYTA